MARVAVIGCGAAGTLCAGLMADAGNDVYCIARRAEHAEAMDLYGVRVEGLTGDRVAPVTGSTSAEGIGACDIVVIATRCFDVADAARKALPVIGPRTVVQSLQNGLGSHDVIAGIVDPSRLAVGVMTGLGARLNAPGHVQHDVLEDVAMAPYRDLPMIDLEAAAAVWRGSGFRVRVSQDAERTVWDKLVVNAGFSGVTALTGMTLRQVMTDPSAWSVARDCAEEAVAVARAKGIEMDAGAAVHRLRAIGMRMPDARSQLLIDHSRGRRAEIDAIHGAIASLGASLGVPTPINRTVVDLLRARESVF